MRISRKQSKGKDTGQGRCGLQMKKIIILGSVCASLPLHGILPMGTEGCVALAR